MLESFIVAQTVGSEVHKLEPPEAFDVLYLNLALVTYSCLSIAENLGLVYDFCGLLNVRGYTLGGSWAAIESTNPTVELFDRHFALLGPHHQEVSLVHFAVIVIVVSRTVHGGNSVFEP